MPTIVYARRGPIQYGPRVPQDVVERDEVFALKGEINDERLMRQGQFALVSEHAHPVTCGKCTKKFLTEAALEYHGLRAHKRSTDEVVRDAVRANEDTIRRDLANRSVADATAIVEAQDRQAEREDVRLEAERPLHWDKTEAAIKAGDAPVLEVTTTKSAKPRARKRPSVRREATA